MALRTTTSQLQLVRRVMALVALSAIGPVLGIWWGFVAAVAAVGAFRDLVRPPPSAHRRMDRPAHGLAGRSPG